MRFLPLMLAVTLAASAQTPATTVTPPPQQPVDPKLHADAVKLVEVSGARQQILAKLPETIENGKQAMLDKCPTCTQAFADEWAKRMGQRLSVDEFLNVFVEEYQKFLTDPEILELISLQQNKGTTPPPVPSDELKSKLSSVMPSLQGEILGRCTEIGAKLGGEIGEEIETEHPEYMKKPLPPASATPKP